MRHSIERPWLHDLAGCGRRSVELALDLVAHASGGVELGATADFALQPMSVAAFHGKMLDLIDASAARPRSTAGRTRSPTPCRSPRTAPNVPMTPKPSTASSGPDRRVVGLPALSHRLSRQGEPGASLLGQLRPGGDALLGTRARLCTRAACRHFPMRSRARPTATRCRRPASGRAAGRRLPRILLLRLSRARQVSPTSGRAVGRGLSYGPRRVRAAL